MKVLVASINLGFCKHILKELREHHEVKVWNEKEELKPLVEWCDLIYAETIQRPLPKLSRSNEKPIVARMDGLDVMIHSTIDWRNVNALIIQPIQMKRLERLRGKFEWEHGHKLPPLPKEIRIANIGVDLDKLTFKQRSSGYNIVFHSSYMGRATKQPYIILQSFAELIRQDPKKPWKLFFIGNWEGTAGHGWGEEYAMGVEELREQLHPELEDRVDYLPGLTHDLWVKLLEKMDVSWNYSYRESFGVSQAEGCAVGVHPIMNWFFGAELLYPKYHLCRSPTELVEKTITWGNLSMEAKRARRVGSKNHVAKWSAKQTAVNIRKLCEEVYNELQ